MTDTSPQTTRSRVWRYLMGVFVGVIFALAILVWIVSIMATVYTSHYEALNSLIAAVFGFPVALVLGSLLGIVWMHRVSRSSRPNRVLWGGLCSSIAFVILLFLALPAAKDFATGRAGKSRQRTVDRYVKQDMNESQTRWDTAYNSQYPRQQSSLPKLLGPLYIPDSRLVEWKNMDWGSEEVALPHPPGWEITVEADASADEVFAHYMAVLPEGIEGYAVGNVPGPTGEWVSSSANQPSADGRITRVLLHGDGNKVRIRFKTMTEMAFGEHAEAPWPDMATYREEVQAKRQPLLDAIYDEFGDWIYPNAQLVFGDLKSLKNTAFETTDHMDDVVAFYQNHGKEPQWNGTKWVFRTRGAFVRTPEVYVYPVHAATRIHFRFMR